ncbi:hypothetical protein EI94DRAFT_1818036 [Lactarius quietus]|nr:hypothetical protein EI94DRAFT_1818036 [Lactarius quietus]
MTHGGACLMITNVLVSQANQTLNAPYQLYRYTETNDTIICTIGYSLPEVLHTQIQTVAPTTYFASSRMLRQTPHTRSVRSAQAGSGKLAKALLHRDDDDISPSHLRWLYATEAYIPTSTDRNELAVTGFGMNVLAGRI